MASTLDTVASVKSSATRKSVISSAFPLVFGGLWSKISPAWAGMAQYSAAAKIVVRIGFMAVSLFQRRRQQRRSVVCSVGEHVIAEGDHGSAAKNSEAVSGELGVTDSYRSSSAHRQAESQILKRAGVQKPCRCRGTGQQRQASGGASRAPEFRIP